MQVDEEVIKISEIGSITFTIDRHPFLQKLGFKPKKKRVSITSIRFGVRTLYSRIINELVNDWDIDKISLIEIDKLFIGQFSDKLALAFAYVIHNSEKNPPRWLIRQLKKMNQQEFNAIAGLIEKSIDRIGFLTSVMIVTGAAIPLREIVGDDKEDEVN